MFLGHPDPDPDPLVRGVDPDPSIITQNSFVVSFGFFIFDI
jgi:hypothetical protein